MRAMSSYFTFLDAAAMHRELMARVSVGPQPGSPGPSAGPSAWQPMHCPACGHQLRVPHDAAGRIGRCRACRTQFPIPTGEGSAALSPAG
jgi:hypothetical protein